MANPANEKDKSVLPKNFRPMSAPVQALAVPEREGYHRRWFRGEPRRIAQAQQAGYTFVDPANVSVKNSDLGGDADASGNSDLGTRVSVIAGGLDASGQAERLYLMEVPNELYEMSRKFVDDRNDSIARALKGGFAEGDDAERNSRYLGANSSAKVGNLNRGLFDKK